MNTVDSIESFVSDVKHGHWDTVLSVVSHLKLSSAAMVHLYEQARPFIYPSQESNRNFRILYYHYFYFYLYFYFYFYFD